MQPIQQQGRLIPSLSSVIVLLSRFTLVSSSLGLITQQIHSLRASGVKLVHFSTALLSAFRADPKSLGSSCTVPPGKLLGFIFTILPNCVLLMLCEPQL